MYLFIYFISKLLNTERCCMSKIVVSVDSIWSVSNFLFYGQISNCSLFLSIFKVEIATLTRENGKTRIKVLKQKEVEELIKKHEAEEAKAEKDKKEKEQKEKDK